MARLEDRRTGALEAWRSRFEAAPVRGDELFTTISGAAVEPLSTPETTGVDYERDLGYPGSFPFTRGVYPTMFPGRLWTMRQLAGFGTAEETK
jgi:methylmalonyl-CoA mutase N-terminal domain/subunit